MAQLEVHSKEIVGKVMTWLSWADSDYIAARIMFRDHYLLQATQLSCTAVEKYLKTLLLLLNINIPKGYAGHNLEELYKKIKNSGIDLSINDEDLLFLKKCYQLRYPDELEESFEILIDEKSR